MMAATPRRLGDATDEALVALIFDDTARRPEAWSVLVERLSPRLYAVARSFRLDAATSEDLVQTAWLRVIERGDQLREPGALRPWMAMIVRNEARKLVTRTRSTPVAEGWDEAPDDRSADPSGRLVQAERAATVRSAFARLGAECRQLIRLTIADPALSYDEIAAAVGRPRGSLGPTRRRCLERLRSMLPDEAVE